MTSIDLSCDIRAPITEVFAHLTDFENAPEMVGGITEVNMLTEGPLRVGTRFEETRVMFGREATEQMEVTELDSPRMYTLGAESHGSRYASTFRLSETATGTRVHLDFTATPLTLFAKVMSVLMKPMMKKVLTECSKDLEDIKSFIESRQPAPPATA